MDLGNLFSGAKKAAELAAQRAAQEAARKAVSAAQKGATEAAQKAAGNAFGGYAAAGSASAPAEYTGQKINEQKVVLSAMPKSLPEMQAMPEAALTDPFKTAALTIAALNAFEENREEAFRMLNFLRGPRPMNPTEQQQIRDRFMDGQGFVVRSYFDGALPANNYTASEPKTLSFFETPYSRSEENYIELYILSGGADSPRSVKLRLKPSTGQWFLWDQFLLAGVRVPQAMDAWA